MKHIGVVVGTRPEAIKMAPVILALQRSKAFKVSVVCSGQHRELLDGVFELFGLSTDFNMGVMSPGQGLSELSSKVILAMDSLMGDQEFDLVLVHGDTTTAMASAMAAFYRGIPVAHVEAGLRTRNLQAPFPEEFNRQVIARLASLNFAATDVSAKNLIAEAVPQESIYVTGNTVVDAVKLVFEKFLSNDQWVESAFAKLSVEIPGLSRDSAFVLVTLHRRENHGENFRKVLDAIKDLALKNPEVLFLFPVHPNPIIKTVAEEYFGGVENVVLCRPFGYLELLLILGLSKVTISDSGGIQEEGLTLSTPVLVARNDTERPEGLNLGKLELVGSDTARIVERALVFIESQPRPKSLGLELENNPFGAGEASSKIVSALTQYLKQGDM